MSGSLAPKLYLMTTTCSGKSHFVREHPHYGGLEIVDFSKVNKAMAAMSEPSPSMSRGDAYRERIMAYLLQRTGPVCVLGRRGHVDPPMTVGIDYGVVLLSVDEHRRNWESRRSARPATRWQSFDDIEPIREKLREYAERYGIPVFDSFQMAIEALTQK